MEQTAEYHLNKMKKAREQINQAENDLYALKRELETNQTQQKDSDTSAYTMGNLKSQEEYLKNKRVTLNRMKNELTIEYINTAAAAGIWAALKKPDSLKNAQWKETTEKQYWEMLGALPPIRQTRAAFMVGEPYDHIEAGPTYQVYIRHAATGKYFTRLDTLLTWNPGLYQTEITEQLSLQQ